MMASKYFAGMAPTGWKVVNVDSQETESPATNAIDGDPKTIWQTRANANATLPHQLTIDMGDLHRIAGLTYLPRQDRSRKGVIETYRFETSVDGTNWTAAIRLGRFGNIRNNPELQEVAFSPIEARFFRFTALSEVDSGSLSTAAEISVLPAEDEKVQNRLH
jgi:alpha-L-fucosidase